VGGSCGQKLVQRSNRIGQNISSIKKLKVCQNARTIALGKGKGCFIKDDVARDDDSIGGEIKAAVSFVMSGIVEEDTQDEPRSEFMRSGGRHIWVTLVAKDSQMIIFQQRAEQGKVWRGDL
jgi:hypothetical protein